MRVADYVMDALYRAGGDKVFGVSGGMIMHLTDALFENKRQEFVAMHQETAAVMAADGASRLTGRIGVALVTAGPGALNAIPGAAGAFVDGAPVVIVAGQSKREQIVEGPRQFALQGFNTLPLARQVTKYAALIDNPCDARYHVERAIYEATSGHPGPVWLEIPVDVQAIDIRPDQLRSFEDPTNSRAVAETNEGLDKMVDEVVEMLRASKRPVILAGAGVRSGGGVYVLQSLAAKTEIPVLTSRLGMDLLPDASPYFAGHPGTYGDRTANTVCQNADLIIVVGCRLAVGLVGYDFANWAPKAKKVMVDLDPNELAKPSVKIDLPILADAGRFLLRLKWKMDDVLRGRWSNHADWRVWLKQIQAWRVKYPVDLPEYDDSTGLNSYRFTRVMSECMKKDALFVVDTGSCFHVHTQAFKVKARQRHIITGGLSTMGFMPAAIGVAKAAPGQDVWCITGDGSLQMNLQELATIVHHKLPIKLVVHNNDGYLLIRNTQKNFCGGRLIGESPSTGVSFPDLEPLADAYGIEYVSISHEESIRPSLEYARGFKGPVIIDVMMKREQVLQPRVTARKLEDGTMVSAAYDDMSPNLPREEYEANNLWEKS